MRKKAILLFLMFFCAFSLSAQVFSRIEADFSVKEVGSNGIQRLTTGKVYFDKNLKKVVYFTSFPQEEIIIITDSLTYQVQNDSIKRKSKAINLASFSIFNLSLNGNLPYYGLQNTFYELTDIKNEGNMVISSWSLPETKKTGKSNILLLSQKDKLLFGLITMAPDSIIISKQFFEKYTQIDGLSFPQEITQFFYYDGKEEIKRTNFKNIIINNFSENKYYNYPVPPGR
ncbi:MAG: hypothetical protein JXB17_08170 [Bacteroidales bacterium]|nr:hypothetical protein [Bacteroidales bacterium]